MRCYSSISIFIELWFFFSSPQPWQQKMTNGRPVEILRLRTRLNCKAGFQIDNQITVSLKKLPGPHSLYNAIGKIIVLNEYNIIFFFSPFFWGKYRKHAHRSNRGHSFLWDGNMLITLIQQLTFFVFFCFFSLVAILSLSEVCCFEVLIHILIHIIKNDRQTDR